MTFLIYKKEKKEKGGEQLSIIFDYTNATNSFWGWSYDNELPCHKEEEEQGVKGNSAEEHSDIVLQ